MLTLLSSSCRQGILRIPCSRFPDGAANGALEKSPLFRVIRSLRSSAGEKTLFGLTALFSSDSGEGDGDAAKSVDAKAAEEAEYASTGAEVEDAKASSAIVPTIPRPEDHPKVGVAPVEDKIRESRLRWFGHIKWRRSDDPVKKVEDTMEKKDSCSRPHILDSKLLSALADKCKRSITYTGAFLLKDEPEIDPSLVSSIETGKNIYEIKGQELFNRLHDIGTLAQISSIQQNEVYLLGHHRLRKMEMVGLAPVEDKIRESRLRWFGHIKWRPSDDPELPYNEDDDVIKATYFEVILTLRDVLKISSVWREYAKTYSRN